MSLSFANAIGNLFNRLGKMGAVVKQLRSYQNTQNTSITDPTSGITAQLNAEPDVQAIIGNSYIGLLNAVGGAGYTMQNAAQATLNRMVFRDNPQQGQTLQSGDVTKSLTEVIRQMEVAGATVLAATVGASVGSWTGTGNGAIVVSTKRPKDGKTLEDAFAEDITLKVNSDSYSGSATAGREGITITGEGRQSDYFAFDWPLGSNANSSLSVIDGASDNTNGNMLTNSGFDNWTDSSPDSWTIVAGTPGTDIVEEVTLILGSGSALKIIGDGSTTLEWKQQFDTTANALSTLSQYGFNVYLRRDGTAAGAGELVVSLVDGTNTIINDANGVANSLTIDLTALTLDYTAYNVSFRTPAILPSEQYIRFQTTTPLTNTRAVYLDLGGMGGMTQAYTSGPYLSVFAGGTPFLIGDYAMVTITNSRGSGGTLDTWQTLFSRFFPQKITSELLLPSSSTPTISDTLIA